MHFTKMHGLGNDFVVVDNINDEIDKPNELAVKLSDRHLGIGADGLILICKSDIADFRMRIFNSDGSEAEMCGNGIRCVGKYVYDNKFTDKINVEIETLGGIKKLELILQDGTVTQVRVDMGEPILTPTKIPMISDKDEIINEVFAINGEKYNITAVSVGNPHAIIFVENADKIDVEKIGKMIENYKELFPNRTNVEFIEVISENKIKVRVWERGVGETQACGTAACASVVASVLNNKTSRKIEVLLLGGVLYFEWLEDNHVLMTGPAETVFVGRWLG
ncbi:MAG: diaminopimelate epimerase [Clostridiales bacterium GWE2_32_10]|nr:MAG: diaminopimelate epimerase [Clostridiales bacterium GWE2_32_10]HBY20306.1 diaminopimelate epimerase [Clostridiales bacterium]